MAKKELGKSNLIKIIEAVVLLIVGILLCCALSINQLINYTLGTVLILGGAIILVSTLLDTKSFLNKGGVMAGALIALGILCFNQGLIPFEQLIIMFLIVIGAILLVDGVLGFVPNFKKSPVTNTIELVIGAVSFTLGMVFWFVSEATRYATLTIGIVFILLAILLVVSIFVQPKKK